MASGSRTAVLAAIGGNAVLTVLKFTAALVTHSAAMMNEAVHSLVDTLNQVFLLMGLRQGGRSADHLYAFGHGQKKYLWNLWSAIGLFSIGCGLGLAHAWHVWHNSGDGFVAGDIALGGVAIDSLWISGSVLTAALLIEGQVLRIAWREFAAGARTQGIQPWRRLLEPDDPTLLAVVLEDAIAVIGVVLAATGIVLARFTGDISWDVGFSVAIALMLGVTAVILGRINMRFLSDIRDREAEAAFIEIAASHREIERYHDLRSIVLDEHHTVLVAEVEIREESMLAGLRDSIDEQQARLLALVPDRKRDDADLLNYVADRAAVQVTLERTERIIDELEAQLRARCPRVSHVTIEVQGIADDDRSQYRIHSNQPERL